jgi:iron complex transport system substrate-binding protein/vitamin B12 transport system substrate-binding protein
VRLRAAAWLACALAIAAACTGAAATAGTARTAVDADGRQVHLAHPARRIVTLAPHLAEAVFALGAGERLVAVSDHYDFPPAARRLPRVGDAFSVQLEAVLALRPDLVLAWGASGQALSRTALERGGSALYVSRPVRLLDVTTELRALGRLLGTEARAESLARAYAARLRGAAEIGRGRARGVFVQMGAPSLYTVGDRHYLGEAVRLCGAVTVFEELRGSAPLVSAEAVLARRPDIVLALDDLPAGIAADWRRRGLHDVRRVPSTLLGRPGPRLADGVFAMCTALGH